MRARRTKATFRLTYEVNARIEAAPERVWAVLTDASRFTHWNSTVSSLEGEIAEGRTIELQVKGAAPARRFHLKISDVVPNRSMTWTDGIRTMFRSVRTHTLTRLPDGATEFSMVEELRGLMLPVIADALPDFGHVFEHYAADLKREAETRI